MSTVTTNDGVSLAYEKSGDSGPVVILIHGWSGSRQYFVRNANALAESCVVYRYDQRFHGQSDKPDWGFSVARLAADLKCFIDELKLVEEKKPVVVGTSLGSAVIWAYIELYGDSSLSKCVFVDQAPSQWQMPDWQYGSKGIYDAKSLADVQAAVMQDMDSFADANAECCFSKPPSEEIVAMLKSETLLCRGEHLAKLMADHACKDWRPILGLISVPCLSLYGTDSGCFPPEGCEAVAELIPDCRSVPFEGFNHWLYLEDPERFNKLIVDFVLG
jgi:pimeloyl-ACP methyl ester carboxylesterase